MPSERRHDDVPPPVAVRYNDWPAVDVPPLATFVPRLGLSVVVSYFEAMDKLRLTLAALEAQTYPRELIQVVIVDDGSNPPLEAPSSPFDIVVVHQERRGFGLARARNNGAQVAVHDILVFLDGDVIAEADLLAAHARWHHTVADALTLGNRTYMPTVELGPDTIRALGGRFGSVFAAPCSDSRRQQFRETTNDLTALRDDLFNAMVGCNFGVRKDFYLAVGGCDESFTRYGMEDTEFAYRAYARGALLVPANDAFAWHNGLWEEDREDKWRFMDSWRPKRANLIPHPSAFRPVSPGRIYAVPKHVVTICVGNEPLDLITETILGVLADPETDLVVRVEMPGYRTEETTRLEEGFGPDPRVRLSPAGLSHEDFPASPFHISLTPAFLPRGSLVGALRDKLGTAVEATAILRDGTPVSITRSWALHRAERAGGKPADFGDIRTVVVDTRWPRPHRVKQAWPPFVRLRRRVHRVLTEASSVRDARSALTFVRWLFFLLLRKTKPKRRTQRAQRMTGTS